MNKKTFVLDTSVLLYDMKSIHSFSNIDVIVPLTVLDELDRFKSKPGLLGESARYVNRFLDNLRELGSLHDGITLKDNNQTIKVELNHTDNVPKDLDSRDADNKIISVALSLLSQGKNVTVITKDINFRVKCDALSLPSEDYYKDHIELDNGKIFSGVSTITLSPEDIDTFYKKGTIPIDNSDLLPNQFVVSKHGNQSLLAQYKKSKLTSIFFELDQLIDIKPRNKEQKFALSLLSDDLISLVSLTGIAGSGKTFLTLMAGLSGHYSGKYKRIIITRSIQPVGKDIGFLPGDINEKMEPWITPIVDNFRVAFNDLTYFDMMRQKGQIEIAPLSFIRGRTFNDSFIIVDEAQNATIHELKTVITRVGEGSKIVLLGDVEQIDTPYIDTMSNGLTVIIEKLKNSPLTGHVSLLKGERSKIATYASKNL